MSSVTLSPFVAPLRNPKARPLPTFTPSNSPDLREHAVQVPDLAIDMGVELDYLFPYVFFTPTYAVCFFFFFLF